MEAVQIDGVVLRSEIASVTKPTNVNYSGLTLVTLKSGKYLLVEWPSFEELVGEFVGVNEFLNIRQGTM